MCRTSAAAAAMVAVVVVVAVVTVTVVAIVAVVVVTVAVVVVPAMALSAVAVGVVKVVAVGGIVPAALAVVAVKRYGSRLRWAATRARRQWHTCRQWARVGCPMRIGSGGLVTTIVGYCRGKVDRVRHGPHEMRKRLDMAAVNGYSGVE